MPLSEYVWSMYTVAIIFKMTEWIEQEMYINFCVKLEHSSVETIGMIQKASAMGNWWLAASWQCACSCIMSSAEFFGETSNHPGYTAQIWWPAISGSSQNKNHLWKGKDVRPLMRFRKIWRGSWWWLEELCEVPRCLLWRGLRHHYPMYNVSCILYLFQ